MDIFIKPVKKAVVTGRRAVMLKDIAEVYCQTDKSLNVGDIIVFNIPSDSTGKSYLVSAMDIVKAIGHKIPNASINNLGEMDTVIEYFPKPKKKSKPFDRRPASRTPIFYAYNRFCRVGSSDSNNSSNWVVIRRGYDSNYEFSFGFPDAGCVPDDVQDFLRSRVDKTLYNICSVQYRTCRGDNCVF